MLRRNGFTLIELLTSIFVIASLLGMLLPAIGGVRESARCAACGSNVRQVQLANMLFAQDHADRCVPGAADITGANLHRWHGERSAVSDPFDPDRGDLTMYLDGSDLSRRVRACPSFIDTLDDLQHRGAGFERGGGGYGYNNAFIGTQRRMNRSMRWMIVDDSAGSKRSKFAAPSATLAFADSAFAASELIEYSFVEPRKWPDRPRFRPDPSIHFRHAERANIAWLDGHVSSRTMTFTASSGLYRVDPAELGIGWFGVHDDNRLFDYE